MNEKSEQPNADQVHLAQSSGQHGPALTPLLWRLDAEGNRILACDARETIICHLSASCRNPDVLADANLIVAAPDLLAILRAAEDDLESLLEFAQIHGWQPQNERATLRRIDAAIAKATGAA